MDGTYIPSNDMVPFAKELIAALARPESLKVKGVINPTITPDDLT